MGTVGEEPAIDVGDKESRLQRSPKQKIRWAHPGLRWAQLLLFFAALLIGITAGQDSTSWRIVGVSLLGASAAILVANSLVVRSMRRRGKVPVEYHGPAWTADEAYARTVLRWSRTKRGKTSNSSIDPSTPPSRESPPL
jgi:hypothetical protein